MCISTHFSLLLLLRNNRCCGVLISCALGPRNPHPHRRGSREIGKCHSPSHGHAWTRYSFEAPGIPPAWRRWRSWVAAGPARNFWRTVNAKKRAGSLDMSSCFIISPATCLCLPCCLIFYPRAVLASSFVYAHVSWMTWTWASKGEQRFVNCLLPCCLLAGGGKGS